MKRSIGFWIRGGGCRISESREFEGLRMRERNDIGQIGELPMEESAFISEPIWKERQCRVKGRA